MSRSAYSAQPSPWPERNPNARWKRDSCSDEVLHLRDLEVMAGDAFVVAGAHLAPEREASCGPASGTTCGRAGVKSSLGPV